MSNWAEIKKIKTKKRSSKEMKTLLFSTSFRTQKWKGIRILSHEVQIKLVSFWVHSPMQNHPKNHEI
jgi:hypothetical protein